MELRRITGPDVKTALRLVREQLGADAMILSNRRVSDGVEIVATVEASIAQAPSAGAGKAADRTPHSSPAERVKPAGLEEVASPASRQLEDLQAELRSMRTLLDQGLGEIRCAGIGIDPGVEGRVWRRLTRLGIPNALVSELVSGIGFPTSEEQAWALVLERMASCIETAGDIIATGGVWACVGPTGAGKTTTVCKLAVRHALEHGTQGLVLLSLDGSRIGGADTLRTVARLLDVPFHTVPPGGTLTGVLDGISDARLVLVDTAGISRTSVTAAAHLEELGELRGRVRTLLVLPATVQYACLEAAVRGYAMSHPVAAVITRLDEAASLGEVIGVLAQAHLPVAYCSDGVDVPTDLHISAGRELLDRLLELGSGTGPVGASAGSATLSGPRARVADIADAARIVG